MPLSYIATRLLLRKAVSLHPVAGLGGCEPPDWLRWRCLGRGLRAAGRLLDQAGAVLCPDLHRGRAGRGLARPFTQLVATGYWRI